MADLHYLIIYHRRTDILSFDPVPFYTLREMRRLFAAIGFTLLLTGCGAVTPAEPAEEAPVPETAVHTKPRYIPYAPRELDSRRGAILFFASSGDRFSVNNDHLLQSLYESGSVSVSTYRVDFGSATGARLKYGVIVEDTFILLDASGERVGAYTHPSPDEVRILVQGRVPVPSAP